MNLQFLVEELLPKRNKEISEGKNLSTRQPIYVVLDLQENYCSGHSDYSLSSNYKGIDLEHGYIDNALEGESRTFSTNDDGMDSPQEVTRFFTDRIMAFFLTSEGAHDYLDYQSHNLSNAYVYVFYSGYGNREMDRLLNNE